MVAPKAGLCRVCEQQKEEECIAELECKIPDGNVCYVSNNERKKENHNEMKYLMPWINLRFNCFMLCICILHLYLYL